MEKYKVFSVGWDHVILPEGGPFSKGWDRFVGNRVVEVVDTNQNDRPDDGDTAILADGSCVSRAKFSDPLVQKLVRQEDDLTLVFRKLRGKGTVFDVRDVSPKSFEAYCIAQADYFQDQQKEAKEIASSVTDHPIAAGTIATIGVVLLFHPKTKIPARIGAEWLRALGWGGGIAYVAHDRLDGLVNKTPMGEHDLTAGLAIWGGASAFRGVTLKNFASNTLQGLGRIKNFLGFGQGGFTPGLVASGAGGGSFIFSGAGALEAAPAIAAGGRLPSAMGGLPVYNFVATFPTAGGGAPKVRELRISEGLDRLDDVAWSSSRAKKSVDDIRSALEIAKEEAEAAGRLEDAAQIGEALDEVDQNMKVIEEIYRHATDVEARTIIATLLRDVEREALALFSSADGELVSLTLNGVRQRMLIVRDLAQRYRIGSFKVPTSGVSQTTLDLPDGVELARPIEDLLPFDPGTRNMFLNALQRFLRNFKGGNLRGLKPLEGNGAGLTEVKFRNHSGPRIYLVFKNGKAHILRVGNKETQNQDIAAAKRLAEQLGLLTTALFVWENYGEEGSTAPIFSRSN